MGPSPWPTVEPTIQPLWAIFFVRKRRRRPWLPASHNILRAFTIPFDSIKVLIVGQDPYPTPGHPWVGWLLRGAKCSPAAEKPGQYL